ncbi:hypothetical protein AtubIFM57258_010161 [Aspergillus tubingensis]|nr:hypothetical protein AtubIFM57258_010161 [Aspergillus tubingensis]
MAEKANPPAVPTYEEQQQTETHELSSREMPAYAQPPTEQTPEIQPHQPQQTFYAGSQHPSGYNTPTPLYALQKTPAPVDCPACGERKMTRVEAETGSSTQSWASSICLDQSSFTEAARSLFIMAAIDLLALEARHQVIKRSNWAGENPGVVLVFCIVFIVAVGIIALFIYRKCMARKAAKQSYEVEA